MPQIPQVNMPLPDVRPAGGARYDTHMYDAQARANEMMGQAVQQTGGIVMDLVQRRQDALNYATTVKADTQMRLAGEDFHNWAKQNPDPSKWSPELDARIKKIEEDMFQNQGDMPPVVRQRLKVQFGQWADLTRKSTEVAATSKRIEEGAADTEENARLLVNQGDPASAERVIREGVAHGFFSPVVGERKVLLARKQASLNQANALLNADPFAAEKNVDEIFKGLPALSDTDKKIFRSNAIRAANQQREVMIQDFNRQAIAAQGNRDAVDMDEVYAKAEAAGIKKQTVDNIFKPAVGFDADGAAKINATIAQYDAGADEANGFTQKWQIRKAIAELSIPQADKAELNSTLERTSANKNLLTRTEAGKLAMKAIDDAFTHKFYGDWEMEDTPAGPMKRDQPDANIYAKAELTRAKNVTALSTWLKDHPQATPEEAVKYVQGLHGKTASSAGTTSFNPFLAKPASTESVQDKLNRILK